MPALRQGRRDATFCALLHQADALRAAQWRDYLDDCRACCHDEVGEQRAWQRLQRRLEAIDEELARRLAATRRLQG